MSHAEGQGAKCPSCGAEVVFDAGKQAMVCRHCGAKEAVRSAARFVAKEYTIESGLRAAARGGLGPDILALACSDCGAVVTLRDRARTASCPFCASKQVVPRELDPNAIRPESLVPFRTPQAEANARFAKWLGSLWFRPNDLRKLAAVEEMRGVYVPFWTFDARADSDWSAERGDHYYVTETYTEQVNGQTVTKTRQVQHTRWTSVSGSRHDAYDDWLVCAGRGLPEKLVRKFATLDTSSLQPYDTKFLAGWQAEAYSTDLPAAWQVAQREIAGDQEKRCRGDVGGDTQRGLEVTTHLERPTFKHVLLPIWICAYRYRDKTYRFLINGESGELVGVAPWSFFKIGALVLFVLACVLGVMAYAKEHRRSSSPPPSQTVRAELTARPLRPTTLDDPFSHGFSTATTAGTGTTNAGRKTTLRAPP